MKKTILFFVTLFGCLLLAACGLTQPEDHANTDGAELDASVTEPETPEPEPDATETEPEAPETESGTPDGEPETPTTEAGDSATEAESDTSEAEKIDAIPFEEGQYYAVAFLGYQEMEDWTYYAEQYLDSEELPTYYLSSGEYYLVIPRYDGMAMALYQNDMETMEPVLVYEEPDCQPFILQCNASDIFADATIRLTYQEETVEFSPFVSLKDGSVVVGEYGLDLTKNAVE